jgi:hypothetical protein
VHLRRALLLFAIVLGMAALVASLSRPIEERRSDSSQREPADTTPPTASPTPAPDLPEALSFEASENETMRLQAGHAATVEVSVEEPGSVDIPRMDVLASRPGPYQLLFTPAGGNPTEPAGRLVVTSAG